MSLVQSAPMKVVDLHSIASAPRVDRLEVARIRRDVPDPWQLRVVLLNGESRVFRGITLSDAAQEAQKWLE